MSFKNKQIFQEETLQTPKLALLLFCSALRYCTVMTQTVVLTIKSLFSYQAEKKKMVHEANQKNDALVCFFFF